MMSSGSPGLAHCSQMSTTHCVLKRVIWEKKTKKWFGYIEKQSNNSVNFFYVANDFHFT